MKHELARVPGGAHQAVRRGPLHRHCLPRLRQVLPQGPPPAPGRDQQRQHVADVIQCCKFSYHMGGVDLDETTEEKHVGVLISNTQIQRSLCQGSKEGEPGA